MPFGYQTPESLLPRSDSKNAATTCKGITTTGRPCRNPLAASLQASPTPSPSRAHGVLAMLQGDPNDSANLAAFYCWRHKDQADDLMAKDTQKTKLYPLKERASIDTLVSRLGVLEIDEQVTRKHKHKRRRRKEEPQLRKRDTLPSGWHDLEGPLMTVRKERQISKPASKPRPGPGRSNLKPSFLCCLQADDEDYPPARTRHGQQKGSSDERYQYQQPVPMGYKARPEHNSGPHTNTPPQNHGTPIFPQPAASSRIIYPDLPPPDGFTSPLPRPRPLESPTSSTQNLLSLIPPALSPSITSTLLAELSRPLTANDSSTSGYIYIFWLTPDTDASMPDSDTASSILDAATPSRSPNQDQLLQRYSSQRRTSTSPTQRTILLKIGRATNVHRRLSQWSKQCGHNITLLRYYPSSSRAGPSPGSNSDSPPVVPFLPRVERLIHLELAEKRVKQDKCASCGRGHREWFEVSATRAAVREVDACVRRWAAWGKREKEKDQDQERIG